jgi:ribosome maturation factor RimP
MALRTDAIADWLEPTIQGLGFELWGVEYIAHGKASVLRVFIDAKAGISVEDCAAVSHHISGLLEVEDPLPGEYRLEVSSPGIDRAFFKLSQYAAYTGQVMAVRLRTALPQHPLRQNIKGRLLAVKDSHLKFQVDSEEWSVPFAAIKKARLVPSFD